MSKPIILLDPGHGGSDPGAVETKTGRKESDDVLRLSKRVTHYLSKSPVDVKTTRDGDYAVNLYNRPAYSDQIGAALLVSLHRNSAAVGNTGANGIEVWVHPQAPSKDAAVAQEVLEGLVAVANQSNRGVKYGAYVVLTCKAPAVMVELGFMNNTVDNSCFDQYLDSYAESIAKNACRSVGVDYVSPETGATLPPEVKGYRVVVAYNENPEYAESNLQKAKDAGFEGAYLMAVSSEKVEPA